MTNELELPTIFSTSRASELDAEVRMLIARSGIQVGEWVVLRALEAAVGFARPAPSTSSPPGCWGRWKRSALPPPKSEAIAVDLVSIARRVLNRELLWEVHQGAVLLLAAFPVLFEAGVTTIRKPIGALA